MIHDRKPTPVTSMTIFWWELDIKSSLFQWCTQRRAKEESCVEADQYIKVFCLLLMSKPQDPLIFTCSEIWRKLHVLYQLLSYWPLAAKSSIHLIYQLPNTGLALIQNDGVFEHAGCISFNFNFFSFQFSFTLPLPVLKAILLVNSALHWD